MIEEGCFRFQRQEAGHFTGQYGDRNTPTVRNLSCHSFTQIGQRGHDGWPDAGEAGALVPKLCKKIKIILVSGSHRNSVFVRHKKELATADEDVHTKIWGLALNGRFTIGLPLGGFAHNAPILSPSIM